MSWRAIFSAANPACKASPTSRSLRYRSAQSKCRNPASSASLVAVIVTAAAGIKVPKPSAGIWLAPWMSGILVIGRSEDSIMGYATKLICIRHDLRNSKIRCRVPQTGHQLQISRYWIEHDVRLAVALPWLRWWRRMPWPGKAGMQRGGEGVARREREEARAR